MTAIRLLCLLLTVLNFGCATEGHNLRLGDISMAQERRVLVTFLDQTVNRNLPGNAQDQYHNRGAYQNSSWSMGIAKQLADRYRLQIVAQWPMTELGVSCIVYEVPEPLSVSEMIATLKKDSDISSVQAMQNFQVLAEPASVHSAYTDPYLPLQTAFNALNITEWHKKATGQGVRIALIDSGVDIDHPDLKGQINYSENLAPEPDDHNLADKHGTAVAGVLSARPNNGIGIAGIAPDAQIMALRACWPNQPDALAASCNSYTLALALNQAIRLNCRIINLSLSGPEDILLRMLIDKALSKGIIIIAAVPGKDQSGGFPANFPGVLAVNQTSVANSNEIFAPGNDILTTVPHEAYDFMTGSSFATPHIAGLTALLLQIHPNWQAAEIRQKLQHPETLLNSL